MDLSAEQNALLPAANRGGALEQQWAGDDQQWWDWYVTPAAVRRLADRLAVLLRDEHGDDTR